MEDYERLWKMGDGGQGKVFCVRHKPSGKEYAMKEIVCADKRQLNFALKEIKVLIQLSHQHVVSYIDFFVDFEPRATSISVCLLMEMCEGGDLQEKIKKAKREFMETGCNMVDEPTALDWLQQCAGALQYVHERGYLHRDMKPNNVFFDVFGNVKIGDFGLAADVGFGRESAVGTPYYFAPELLLQQRYDGKVDVWGLGIVMFELLTLRERPLNSEVIESPAAVNSVLDVITSMGFSTPLAELVRDMLQRHPSDRPTPAAIVKRVLELRSSSAMVKQQQQQQQKQRSGSAGGGASRRTSGGGSATSMPPLCRGRPLPGGGTGAAEGPLQVPAPPGKGRPPPLQPPCLQFRDARRNAGPAPAAAAAGASGSGPGCANTGVASSLSGGEHAIPSEVATPVAQSPLLFDCEPPHQQLPTSRGLGALNGVDANKIPAGAPAAAPQPHAKPIRNPSAREGAARGTGAESARMTAKPDVVVEVPRDAPTIAEALRVEGVSKVIVAGGTTHTEPLVLTRPVQLIGLDPSPEICVSSTESAVTITGTGADGGRIANFKITQARQKRQSGEKKPFALEVLTGAWCIDKCKLRSFLGSGIGVLSDSAAPTVTGCKISACKQAGIFVLDGGRGSFISNEISECEYAGLLMKRLANPKFTDNAVHHNGETGVFCHESRGIIEGNRVTANKGCGIVVKGAARPVVRGNVICGNAQAGVFCCDGSEGLITENQISANAKAGILIKTGANPHVTRNNIFDGEETGLYVFEAGRGKVEDNQVTGHANAGILVTTEGNPRVVRNCIARNAYEGVWICKKGRGVFEQNDLRGNGKGAKDIDLSECDVQWINNRET